MAIPQDAVRFRRTYSPRAPDPRIEQEFSPHAECSRHIMPRPASTLRSRQSPECVYRDRLDSEYIGDECREVTKDASVR
jgi:hypothetical protein